MFVIHRADGKTATTGILLYSNDSCIILNFSPIIDIVYENDATYYIMNVGTDAEQHLVILENRSTTRDPGLGRSYTAYAHVTGRSMYNAQYYPMLAALYVDLTPQN